MVEGSNLRAGPGFIVVRSPSCTDGDRHESTTGLSEAVGRMRRRLNAAFMSVDCYKPTGSSQMHNPEHGNSSRKVVMFDT